MIRRIQPQSCQELGVTVVKEAMRQIAGAKRISYLACKGRDPIFIDADTDVASEHMPAYNLMVQKKHLVGC